jgi:hypothetical protein
MVYALDSSGSGQRPMTGSVEHRNEPSGSLKCYEFMRILLKNYFGTAIPRSLILMNYKRQESSRKPLSRCLVVDPSRYVLTSSQQSGSKGINRFP